MSDIAIRAVDLGKKYRIGARQEKYKTLRDTLTTGMLAPFRALRTLFPGPDAASDSMKNMIWALKEVSFEIYRGEVVGIIGRNGAGKSTLLKILSRITEPTSGRAEIYGRVGSLLEVGTGFHPELTGRENIYLNGAILGMKKVEIARQFDAIVDFAEIEKFIDTPVKHYSSGMYLRLAFAVAAHLDPEILLVDEVLAVGDAQFQKKCLGKMEDVAKGGRTVLFVSHNMAAISSLCKKVIWLSDGRVAKNGFPFFVISDYMVSSTTQTKERIWDSPECAPGNEHIRLHRVGVRPQNGQQSDTINIRTPIVVEFEYWNLIPGVCLDISFELTNEYGVVVCNPASFLEPSWHGHAFPHGLFRSICYIPGDLLNDGNHSITLVIARDDSMVLYKHTDILRFQILDTPEMRTNWYGRWHGAIRPNFKWATELISDGIPS